MRTTLVATVVIIIAALTSATPLEAHCTWRHLDHCGNEINKGINEVSRAIDREVVQPVKEAGEWVGRKTDLDNVDDLGEKLGMIGTAVGAVVAGTACTTATLGGCLPLVVGGAVGSGVGSWLDGEPSAYIGVQASTSAPDQEDVPSVDESFPPSDTPPSTADTHDDDQGGGGGTGVGTAVGAVVAGTGSGVGSWLDGEPSAYVGVQASLNAAGADSNPQWRPPNGWDPDWGPAPDAPLASFSSGPVAAEDNREPMPGGYTNNSVGGGDDPEEAGITLDDVAETAKYLWDVKKFFDTVRDIVRVIRPFSAIDLLLSPTDANPPGEMEMMLELHAEHEQQRLLEEEEQLPIETVEPGVLRHPDAPPGGNPVR